MIDTNKIFTIWSDEIEQRLDPVFYRPEIRALLKKLDKVKTFSLGDLMIEMSGGATPKVTEDLYLETGGIPFLRVQNITEEGINLDDVKYIKSEVHEKSLKRSQLKKDDLIFTITGRIGSVAVVPEGFEGNINQHSVRLHLKDDIDGIKISPQYIAIFFNTEIGRQVSLQKVTGGTRPALDYLALRNLPVPIPSYVVQNKIVKKIQDVYAEKRKKEEEIRVILASIDSFVLGELGIELPPQKKSDAAQIWQIWSDSIVGRLDPMYFHPLRLRAIEAIKKSNAPVFLLNEVVKFRREIVEDIPEGAPYLGLENIVSKTGEYVETSEKESIGSAFVFKRGDILFPKLRPYLNKVFYADFDGVCSTEFHVLEVEKCDPYFLFSFLTRSVVVEQTSRLMTGNTLPRLQTEDVENLLIPIPNQSIQEKIVKEVKAIYDKVGNLHQEAETIIAEAQKQTAEMIFSLQP